MWSHAGLLLCLAALVVGQEQPSSTTSTDVTTGTVDSTASASPASTATISTITTGTCEARSINYVTHTLLQQCLGRSYSPYATRTNNATTSTAASGHPVETAPISASTTATHHSPSEHSHTNNTPESVTAGSTTGLASTVTSVTATPLAVPSDSEEESLLDNAKFLSFEDWKKQNLVEKGLPDNIEKSKGAAGEGQARRHPGINNALDGLGEDAEIEIDFGFGSFEPVKQASNLPRAGASSATAQGTAQAPKTQSKDAGKTCKERTNYASFDCAASILKTNPKCKSPLSVLVENKDSYMLNECSQDNKFLIVELCDGVLIDTIVLANFEFFSSMFRTFRVSVSDRYPVKADKWIDLGTYEARNTRDIQPFLIENPQIFARYLRIEFLTHYGSEYYCPLSLIRAHGITMFEQYRMEQQILNGDIDDGEEEDVAVSASALEVPAPTAVIQVTEMVQEGLLSSDKPAAESISVESSPLSSLADSSSKQPSATTPSTDASSATPPSSSALSAPSMSQTDSKADVPATDNSSTDAPVTDSPSIAETSSVPRHNTSASAAAPTTKQPSSSTSMLSQIPRTNATSTEPSNTSSSAPIQDGHNTTLSSPPVASQSSAQSATSQSASASSSYSSSGVSSPETPIVVSSSPSSSSPASVAPSSSIQATSSTPPAPPAPPATQESFFKSIHKRLSFLEANSTLSLQYIEAQSQLLREAFSKVEKRNVATTSKFLEMLNSTVLAEMARFKGEYEQLWQSTVLELASQRDEGRRERDLLGERVSMLAAEMVSQKRLMAAQAILLLLCLSIVVFAKFGTAGVDSSLVQGMQELVMMRSRRSQGHKRKDSNGSLSLGRRWPWESPWASPPRSRDITRPHTASGHEHNLSIEMERELHGVDADLDAHSLVRGSQSPDSRGQGGGHTSNSDTDDPGVDRGLRIRFAPGVDERHDGISEGHDHDGFEDATTSGSSGKAIVGLGLMHRGGLEPAGSGTRLTETRSAPTTPRLPDRTSSGSDASKTR